MSQENLNNPQMDNNGYVDPIATQNGETPKKKMGKGDIAATIVSIALIKLFGIIGALICYGGYWAVRAIAKSRMPLAARIILGIVVALVFVVLLVLFILFSIGVQAGM
ncbi:MAG: hypothetical protein IJF03_11275 [Lachnospiraceae bacterium]|nr:hypothetical protein [Lachnospiraceae bacterium]